MVDFDDMKNSYEMQKQARKIQKELENTHIEAEVDGVNVTVNGKLELISCEIDDKLEGKLRKIENAVLKATAKAMKKSQEISAEKMKSLMGGMGF